MKIKETEKTSFLKENGKKITVAVCIFLLAILAAGSVIAYAIPLRINEDEANDIALKHVKLTSTETVVFEDIKESSDNKNKDTSVSETKTTMKTESKAVQSKGKSNDTASENYIGIEKAKQTALKNANLNNSDVTFTKSKLENDDGRMEYELEFYKGSIEYDYEIDAVSGKIISIDKDYEKNSAKNNNKNISSETLNSKSFIGEAKAKSIAISNSKVNKNDLKYFLCELEFDDGKYKYDIEFKVNYIEYDYEVDALTGNILEFDSENEKYDFD